MKRHLSSRIAVPLSSSIALLLTVVAVSPAHGGAISPSDILIYQVGDNVTNATGNGASPIYIQEINPSLSSQTTPVQSFAISTNATTSLWGSSNGSEGILDLSDNGTLLTFGSWIGQNATEDTILSRGSGELNSSGVYTQPSASDYTVASGDNSGQLRASYSPDGSTFYSSDKYGIYTNGGTSALNSANIRAMKEFGGQLYALSQSAPELSTVTFTGSPATSASLTTASGLSGTDANANDFVLLSSGANGSQLDTMYILDSSSSGKLKKYALIGGTWTAEGSGTTIANGDGITGEVVGGQFELFLTVDPGSSAGGYVEEITDSAAFNAVPTLSTANVLYTAPVGDLVQGVSLAPTPEPSTLAAVVGGLGMLLGFGKMRRGSWKR